MILKPIHSLFVGGLSLFVSRGFRLFRLRFSFGQKRPTHWLTWESFIHIGGIPDDRRHDCRGLFQVVCLKPVVDVHIGVVRALVVFNFILNELKSRKANCVVRLVVGSTCIIRGYCGGLEVNKRLKPFAE